jgi:hypothetical protein
MTTTKLNTMTAIIEAQYRNLAKNHYPYKWVADTDQAGEWGVYLRRAVSAAQIRPDQTTNNQKPD